MLLPQALATQLLPEGVPAETWQSLGGNGSSEPGARACLGLAAALRGTELSPAELSERASSARKEGGGKGGGRADFAQIPECSAVLFRSWRLAALVCLF